MKLLHTDCDCCERAQAIIDRKDAALRTAIATIKALHNINGGGKATWHIYQANAPEMQEICSALTPATETGETK